MTPCVDLPESTARRSSSPSASLSNAAFTVSHCGAGSVLAEEEAADQPALDESGHAIDPRGSSKYSANSSAPNRAAARARQATGSSLLASSKPTAVATVTRAHHVPRSAASALCGPAQNHDNANATGWIVTGVAFASG